MLTNPDYAAFQAASQSLNTTPNGSDFFTASGTSIVHPYVSDPHLAQFWQTACRVRVTDRVTAATQIVQWPQYLLALQAIKITDDVVEVGVVQLTEVNKHEIIERIPAIFVDIKKRLKQLNQLPDSNLSTESLKDFAAFLLYYQTIRSPYVFATATGNIKVLWEDEPANESPSIDIEFTGNQKVIIGCVVLDDHNEFNVTENIIKISGFKPFLEGHGLWEWISNNV